MSISTNKEEVYSQKADIETSSEDYARRFSGKVGEYFLTVQSEITLQLLEQWEKAKVLDVGGGHVVHIRDICAVFLTESGEHGHPARFGKVHKDQGLRCINHDDLILSEK